jgi:hypothetical protein
MVLRVAGLRPWVLGLGFSDFFAMFDLALQDQKPKTKDQRSKPDHGIRSTFDVQRVNKTYVTRLCRHHH